jgi:hypothetical protein
MAENFDLDRGSFNETKEKQDLKGFPFQGHFLGSELVINQAGEQSHNTVGMVVKDNVMTSTQYQSAEQGGDFSLTKTAIFKPDGSFTISGPNFEGSGSCSSENICQYKSDFKMMVPVGDGDKMLMVTISGEDKFEVQANGELVVTGKASIIDPETRQPALDPVTKKPLGSWTTVDHLKKID